MRIITPEKKEAISKMKEEICAWYGVSFEELVTIATFVNFCMEGDYVGALVIYQEWKENYYNHKENLKGGVR